MKRLALLRNGVYPELVVLVMPYNRNGKQGCQFRRRADMIKMPMGVKMDSGDAFSPSTAFKIRLISPPGSIMAAFGDQLGNCSCIIHREVVNADIAGANICPCSRRNSSAGKR
jgi:hypothetical protein